ncbi:hypothetical protein F5Y11DRAFT_220069 [Daldinia sp. FL1419]|nr:hypothetical protein F5Y11DRAFT_220069 [Daldinia sp. FL1419]
MMERKNNCTTGWRFTLNPLFKVMGFINPIPALPLSRCPRAQRLKLTHLPLTANKHKKGAKEGSGVTDFNGCIPYSIETETTTSSGCSTSSKSPDLISGSNTPSQAKPIPSSQHHCSPSPLPATEWRVFPPECIPRFDLADSPIFPEKKLPDIEGVIDKYIVQSATLRKWMKQKRTEVDLLDDMNQQNKNAEGKMLGDGTSTDAAKRQAVIREIQETYAELVDVETIEAQAAYRRQAAEILQTRRRLPLTEAKRMFGSDGRQRPNADPTKRTYLYFAGSPPQLVRLPFDQAVNAGLESIYPSREDASSALPNTLQGLMPLPQISPPPPSLLPEQPARATRPSHIPEWFEHFALPLAGRTPEARWQDLTNRIFVLETRIRENKNGEPPAAWDKNWHEPDERWPFAHWREHGGWWRCRVGTGASVAERRCGVCHDLAGDWARRWRDGGERKGVGRAEEEMKVLQRYIDEAMKVVGERDKAIALEMIRRGDGLAK